MITGILCAIEGEIALLREDMRLHRYARRRAGNFTGAACMAARRCKRPQPGRAPRG